MRSQDINRIAFRKGGSIFVLQGPSAGRESTPAGDTSEQMSVPHRSINTRAGPVAEDPGH